MRTAVKLDEGTDGAATLTMTAMRALAAQTMHQSGIALLVITI